MLIKSNENECLGEWGKDMQYNFFSKTPVSTEKYFCFKFLLFFCLLLSLFMAITDVYGEKIAFFTSLLKKLIEIFVLLKQRILLFKHLFCKVIKKAKSVEFKG